MTQIGYYFYLFDFFIPKETEMTNTLFLKHLFCFYFVNLQFYKNSTKARMEMLVSRFRAFALFKHVVIRDS